MILKGKKVSLRPMTVEEIPAFYRWAAQSEATPFWYGELQGDRVPTYKEFLEDWKRYYFDGSRPEKGRSFVILVGGRAVGQINYNDINREDNSVELDIIIAEDKDKNKGYGSDALQTLSRYLFREMNIKKCWIEVIAKNPRARRAYEKAGFRKTKKFVDTGIECIRMELQNQEWQINNSS
jgi:RimJ/RimL family protein N-acetyltransferase